MQRLESKFYYASLNDVVQKVNKRLTKYLEDQNEENIHDIRTSIRKLEAAWYVLPKKTRQKPTVRKFVKLHKKLFKDNSKVRDYDIILQRLEPLANNEKIKRLIYKKRKQQMIVALKHAKDIKHVDFPQISQNEISTTKLEKRFRKTSIKLIDGIQTLLPVVLSSEDKIEQLHQLRKDCKKLRYILELAPDSESSSFVEKLKQMQDLLGTIHDSDITIDFLKGISSKIDTKDMVEKELEVRSNKYKELVQTQVL